EYRHGVDRQDLGELLDGVVFDGQVARDLRNLVAVRQLVRQQRGELVPLRLRPAGQLLLCRQRQGQVPARVTELAAVGVAGAGLGKDGGYRHVVGPWPPRQVGQRLQPTRDGRRGRLREPRRGAPRPLPPPPLP